MANQLTQPTKVVNPHTGGRERDPRHVFLTSKEVIDRYRWGRTKGYRELRAASFPKPVAGRYRLDLLMKWEDDQLTQTSLAEASLLSAPPPKRHASRRVSP